MAMRLEECGTECSEGDIPAEDTLTPSFGGTHGIWLKNVEKEARDPESHADGEQLESTASAELVSMVQKLGHELAQRLDARLGEGERKLRMEIEDIQVRCLSNAERSLAATNSALFNRVDMQNLELAQRIEECERRLSKVEQMLPTVALPGSFDGMVTKLAAHIDDKLAVIQGELTKTNHLQARIDHRTLESSEFHKRMKVLEQKLKNALAPVASEVGDSKFSNDAVMHSALSDQHLRFNQSAPIAEVAPQQAFLQKFGSLQSDIAEMTTASEFSSLESTMESFGSSGSAHSAKVIDTDRPASSNDEANPSQSSSPSLPRSRSSPPCEFRQLSSRGAMDVKATLENLARQCRKWSMDDEPEMPHCPAACQASSEPVHPYAKSLAQSVTSKLTEVLVPPPTSPGVQSNVLCPRLSLQGLQRFTSAPDRGASSHAMILRGPVGAPQGGA